MTPTIPQPLTTLGSRVRTYLRECFRIDTRSLALFRILLGLLIVADVLLRARNFSFYYIDDGLVSQEMASNWYDFSIFFLTSDPTLIAGLFVLTGLVGVQLVLGYKSRLAVILGFLLVVSFDHHNPLVTSYADTLFRLLLFWAIFLPIGERWSLDAVHRDRTPRQSFVGIASAFVLLQMVTMYFINGINKSPSELWQTGEAAVLVLGIDEMTFLLGDYMRAVPELLQVGGFIWFTILLSSPLLIWLTGRKRMLFATFFFGGHASFALTVRIGAFAYVALAGVILFYQTAFWRDLRTVTEYLGLNGRYHAVRRGFVRGAGYTPALRIGGNRVQAARKFTYMFALFVVVGGVLVSLLVLLPHAGLLLQDHHELEDDQHFDNIIEDSTVGGQIHNVASKFSIDQPEWSIFAGPGPRSHDRYYVFAAETETGEKYDVFNDRELTFERPYDELQNMHETYRMRFFMNSVRRGSGGIDDRYAEHFCETWTAPDGSNITHMSMFVVHEKITTDAIDDPENRDRSSRAFNHHGCGDNSVAIIEEPPF